MAFTAEDIRFDRLDVSVSEHAAGRGVCRLILNLAPLGPVDAHTWNVVESAEARATLRDIVAVGSQVRQRFGDLADLTGDPTQSLERFIAITDAGLHLLDPGQLVVTSPPTFKSKLIYAFGPNEYLPIDATRKAQMANIASHVFIAPSKGGGLGEPEPVLELRDDEILPLRLPALPFIEVTGTGTTVTDAFEVSIYTVRFAYLLKDGSYGPMSQPYIVQTNASGGDTHVDLNFKLVYYPFGDTEIPTTTPRTEWEDVISGVAVLMAHASEFNPVAPQSITRFPHYHVATISSLDLNSEVDVGMNQADISSNPLIDDDALAQHTIRAASAFAYNARLWLGDVAYDFQRPDGLLMLEDDASNGHNRTRAPATGSGLFVRLGVKIRTSNGTFERIGPPVGVNAAAKTQLRWVGIRSVGTTNAFLAITHAGYPDRRAESVQIYTSSDGSAYTLHSEHAMEPAGDNLAAVTQYTGAIDLTTGAVGTTMPTDAESNDVVDRDRNRVLISNRAQPRRFRAARAFQVGIGPGDTVVGFGVNDLPVSEGQFGQYPVYIGCSESIWMSFSDEANDISSLSRAPVSTRRGFVSRYGFTNIDGALAFASRDGIWALRPGATRLDDEPLSAPLHYHTETAGDFFICLDFEAALGYYNDTQRGRRELWVSAGKLTFALSLPHARWFILSRERRQFMLFANVLFALDEADEDVSGGTPLRQLVDEGGTSTPLVDVEILTARGALSGERLGVLERIRRLGVRQRLQLESLKIVVREIEEDDFIDLLVATIDKGDDDVFYTAALKAKYAYLRITGKGRVGQSIEGYHFEHEPRHATRNPATLPLPYVLAGGEITPTGVPWNCREGLLLLVAGWDCPDPLKPICIFVGVNTAPFIFDCPPLSTPPVGQTCTVVLTSDATLGADGLWRFSIVVADNDADLFVQVAAFRYISALLITYPGGTFSVSIGLHVTDLPRVTRQLDFRVQDSNFGSSDTITVEMDFDDLAGNTPTLTFTFTK